MSQAAPPPGVTGPHVVRDSGLVVPAHLAGAPEEPAAAGTTSRIRQDGAVDADGRRRLVFTPEVRKLFSRLARELERDDLVFVLACKPTKAKRVAVKDAATRETIDVIASSPIDGACGQVLLREDEGGEDPGFGCACTRVHFLRGGVPGRF
jgi:hypothetical protein